ncbi:hypothetical protein PENSPDRAFT_695698 [Peniophora sp. CONT]|nr:hypothetical protein PENSPDRAFT_695698 [Peniophora sp. CONT]
MFLTSSNKDIWREDNILYKANAERSGIVTAPIPDNEASSDEEQAEDGALGSAVVPIIGQAANTHSVTGPLTVPGPTIGYGAA